MTKTKLKRLIADLKKDLISEEEAYRLLEDLPYSDIDIAKLDHHREIRRGFPEAVLAKGKNIDHLIQIIRHYEANKKDLLITKVEKPFLHIIKAKFPNLRFNELAQMIYSPHRRATKKNSSILIVTAGTSDIGIAEEAKVVLSLNGYQPKHLYDVGVAGLHRLLDNRGELKKAKVIIVCAGMDGALPSVVSSLVSVPVIAVPTSVGYGANFEGIAPLLSMMNSCSPGICVCNIDNGFGAAYLVHSILSIN